MPKKIYNSMVTDKKTGRHYYECDYCGKLTYRNYGIEIYYTDGGGMGWSRRCACKDCFDKNLKPILQIADRMMKKHE